jgi:hypothetical protein
MSRESQKFLLRSVPPVFCEAQQDESPPVGTGARKLERRPLAPDPYEQQYVEGFPPNGVWFVFFVLN